MSSRTFKKCVINNSSLCRTLQHTASLTSAHWLKNCLSFWQANTVPPQFPKTPLGGWRQLSLRISDLGSHCLPLLREQKNILNREFWRKVVTFLAERSFLCKIVCSYVFYSFLFFQTVMCGVSDDADTDLERVLGWQIQHLIILLFLS